MLRGLNGRRIALAVLGDNPDAEQQTGTVRRALEDAGAQVDTLAPGKGGEQEWHDARYSGLVVVGAHGVPVDADARLSQLAREFLLSEKPIAATGSGTQLVAQAGGEPRVVGHADADVSEFATRVVSEFSNCLEDRDIDEMSEESFPASDPPSTTPVSKAKVAPERDTDAR